MKTLSLNILIIIFFLAGCGNHSSDEQECKSSDNCGNSSSVPFPSDSDTVPTDTGPVPTDTDPIPIELPCPIILTESLPEGNVNEDYIANIEAYGINLHYSLNNAPDYIQIDSNGVISFTPRHIINGILEVVVSNGDCFDSKIFRFNIIPYLNEEGNSYDYYANVFDDTDRYALVSESPSKQVFIDTEFKYYDAELKGLSSALIEQFELNGAEPNKAFTRLRYHLNGDSKCDGNGNYAYINDNDICTNLYEASLLGTVCINPSEPLKQPESSIPTCSSPKHYLSPESLDTQYRFVHETQHAINATILTNYIINLDYTSSLGEQFARAVSDIICGSWGYYGNRVYPISFCDFTLNITPSPNNYAFLYNFCSSPNIENNFDVDNLPAFFQTANDIIVCRNYPSYQSFNLTELKCSLDAAVGGNTYDYFCFQSWDCNNDPGSILGYVPDAYCGFIVQYMIDNNLCVE